MRQDYVVVGGGIMGMCAAYHLARAGASVLLLERQSIASSPPVSSSGDVARIFRTAYGKKRYMTRMCVRSFAWWRHFEEESGCRLFEPSGMIVFGAAGGSTVKRWESPNAASWAADSFHALRAQHLPCELLSASTLRERYPNIVGPDLHDCALLDRTAGILLASQAVHTVRELAVTNGLEVREHSRIEHVIRDGHNVRGLIVDGDEIVVRRAVVFAAGAGNSALLPELRRKTRMTRQQIVHFGAKPARRSPLQALPIVVSLNERRYLYTLERGTRLVVADDDNRPRWKVVDPTRSFPDGADDTFWAQARKFASSVVPALPELTAVEGKSCLYTNTVSENYLVYRKGNAVVISACSGHGFKNGPSVGLMAAQLGMEGQCRWYSQAFSYESAQDFTS
jgi:glycine/D-amino acid oxidase-like deaminating enzyme